MQTDEGGQDVLSDYLRSKAEWRRGQEKEFPNDARHEKSAAALESLADYVETLDPSDRVLERLKPHQFDEETLGGPRTTRAVSRYGLQTIVIADHHPAFLDELAALTGLDAYEHAVEHGDDPSGTLTEFELEAARDGVALRRRYFELRLEQTEEELEQEVKRLRTPTEE